MAPKSQMASKSKVQASSRVLGSVGKPLTTSWPCFLMCRRWFVAASDSKFGLDVLAMRSETMMKRCINRWPEIVGIVAALVFVSLLRVAGPCILPTWATKTKKGAEAWNEIQHEWPLLQTADTLLAMQSVLRTIVIFSALCRSASQKIALLSPEFVWFFSAAIIGRFIAFPLSGDQDYMLMGPAGGALPALFDVVTFVLLICMRLCNRSPTQYTHVGAGLVVAIALAAGNHLLLSETSRLSNIAFAFKEVSEVLAAITHLSNVFTDSGAPGRLRITSMLALQQCLSAYFFTEVFPVGGDQVMERGFGSIVVSGGTVIQLVVLMLAVLCHIAQRAIYARATGQLPPPDASGKKSRRHFTDREDSSVKQQMEPAASKPPSTPPNLSDASSSASTSLPSTPRSGTIGDLDTPKPLEHAPGLLRLCSSYRCLLHDTGHMYAGQELMEICCSEGCISMAHARCFRAASRTLRMRCNTPGCLGKVARFWEVNVGDLSD